MAFRQMTVDSEAGPYQMWVDDATGQTTTTNPALAGAGLGYVNEMRQGPDGAMVDTQLVSTIGGIPADQFITRPRADGRLETYNPKTGQWEKTYRAPFDMAGGNQFVPESIGKPIGGAFIEFNNPAENSGGFMEDFVFPAVVGGIAGGGLLGMAGFGPMAAGSGSLGNIASGGGAFGATEGLGMAGSFDALSGAGLGATGAGSGAMDTSWFEPWMDAATGGGTPAIDDAAANLLMQETAGGNLMGGGAQGSWQQQLLNMGIPLPDSLKSALSTANSGLGAANTLSSLFGGSGGSSGGTGGSLWDILGRAAPGLLGAYASNQQTNAMTDLANKFSEYGAPSRARYEASMTPGFDPTSIAGYQGALDTASQSILRKLSATGGNPYGNPGGLIEANKQIVAGTALPAIQQYQNQNANTGGLGALAAAYPSTQQAATQSGANVYNALGSAVGNVVNPPQTASQSLADIYKLINSGMKAA